MASTGGQPDYGSMAVPSVWRNNRTQAAAKVDALASGGMDDFEIPAFLRKQAD
jgi:cell division protein FtsZ